MTTQTPTPWYANGNRIYRDAGDGIRGDKVAECPSSWNAIDDAAFIVRACNAHEGLIEALERIAWHELTWKESRDVARAALAATEIK